MKKLLFISYFLGITGLYAQRTPNDLNTNTGINPFGHFSERYEVVQDDSVNFDVTINKDKRHHLLSKNIPGLFYLGISPILDDPRSEGNKIKRNIPLNVSLVTGLTALNIFKNRRKTQTMVEIKQFSHDGTLVSTDRLKKLPTKRENVYTFSKKVLVDGYITLTVDNLSNKQIWTNSTFSFNHPFPKITAKPWPNVNPVVNTETPPDPTIDGGWFSPVTIIGYTTNGEFAFHASYEANLGPSQTWQVTGLGGNGGDAGGDGGSAAADPGPEEKSIARNLNNINANKCEAAYIISQGVGALDMATTLALNQLGVEVYMNNHGMSAANTNGASNENAFKHALISAYNYCDLGPTHANAIADLHEECSGQNQNPNIQEFVMDNYNNDRGFQIAATVGCSRADIQNAITNAYHGTGNIRLHDVNGNNIH